MLGRNRTFISCWCTYWLSNDFLFLALERTMSLNRFQTLDLWMIGELAWFLWLSWSVILMGILMCHPFTDPSMPTMEKAWNAWKADDTGRFNGKGQKVVVVYNEQENSKKCSASEKSGKNSVPFSYCTAHNAGYFTSGSYFFYIFRSPVYSWQELTSDSLISLWYEMNDIDIIRTRAELHSIPVVAKKYRERIRRNEMFKLS